MVMMVLQQSHHYGTPPHQHHILKKEWLSRPVQKKQQINPKLYRKSATEK
jgi:hypothetical protein